MELCIGLLLMGILFGSISKDEATAIWYIIQLIGSIVLAVAFLVVLIVMS